MCGRILPHSIVHPFLSEPIAPQPFKFQPQSAGMDKSHDIQRTRNHEDIIRQLEAFPAEVLEAALLILQMRERQAAEQPPTGT